MRNSKIGCGFVLLPVILIAYAAIQIIMDADGRIVGIIAAVLFFVGDLLALWIIFGRSEWDWRMPKWELLSIFTFLVLSELLLRPANVWLWRTNWILIGGALIVSNLPKWMKQKYPEQKALCVIGAAFILCGFFLPKAISLVPPWQQVASIYVEYKSSIFPSPTASPASNIVPTLPGRSSFIPSNGSCAEPLLGGVDWQGRGNLQKALSSYQESLDCSRKHGDLISEAMALDQIGRLQGNLEKFEDSLDSFRQEIAVWKKLGDRANEGRTLNSIGTVYQGMGDPQNALVNYLEALDLSHETGDPIAEMRALNNLGQLKHSLGLYEDAIGYYQDALKIAHSAGNQALKVMFLNNLGGAYHANGDKDEAVKSLSEAILLAREINDPIGERLTGENLERIEGDSTANAGSFQLLQQGDPIDMRTPFDAASSQDDQCNILEQQSIDLGRQGLASDALQIFKRALECYEKNGNLIAQGRTLYGIGTTQLTLGHPDQALSSYQQALEIARQTKDTQSEMVSLLNIGSIEHALGRYDEALASYQQVLVAARNIGDQINEALAHNKLGGIYHETGQYGTALDSYQEALVLFIQLEDNANMAASLVNMGNCYDQMGNFAEALKYLQRALEIAREMGDKSIEADVLFNMGVSYFHQGEYQKALELEKLSLVLVQQNKDVFNEARILDEFGRIYLAIEQYPESINSYNQSLEIRRAMNDPVGVSETLGRLADVFFQQGQYQTAIDYYNQSLLIDQGLNNTIRAGKHMLQIGHVYEQIGQSEIALIQFQKAFELFQEIDNETGMAFALSDMGNIDQQQNQMAGALNHYQDSIGHFQNTRSIDVIEDIHHTLPDEILHAYQNAILLLVQQGRYEEAFQYSEEMRGRGLASQLYEARLNRFIDSQLERSSQIRELESEIWSLKQQLEREILKPTGEQDRDKILSLAGSLRLKNSEYQTLIGIYDSPADTIFNVAPITLTETQEMLEDMTLVEYVVTPHTTIAFVITPQELHAVQINVTQDELSQQIESFHQFSSLKGVPEASRVLHQKLVAPIEALIKTDGILIVPNGILNYVPFAALHDGTHYLIEKHTLAYTPSAGVQLFALDNRKRDHHPPLIFGDPTGDLPEARREAQAIHQIFSFSFTTLPLHQQGDALERWVWAEGGQAGILHFATHGVYDPRNPLYSYILLAGDGQEDGYLEVYEIYQRGLNLENASLVVLSACETNVGFMSNGDEIVGLSRAFIYAGAPTIVSSLWNVNDESTKMLMEKFYSDLEVGKTKADALRVAQLSMIANPKYSHPYYWAAFDLIGDPGEMPQGNVFLSNHWIPIQVGLLIFCFVILTFVNLRIRAILVTKRSAIFWGWLIGLLGLPILLLGLFILGYFLKENLGIALVPQDVVYHILPARHVMMKKPLETILFGGILVVCGGSLTVFGSNLREGRLGKNAWKT